MAKVAARNARGVRNGSLRQAQRFAVGTNIIADRSLECRNG
jgi:hypothetical protein